MSDLRQGMNPDDDPMRREQLRSGPTPCGGALPAEVEAALDEMGCDCGKKGCSDFVNSETVRAHLHHLTAERDALRGERDRLADALDHPWSQGAQFPGYTVCDQCGCFHHITRPHDCKPETHPPEIVAGGLPGVIRRHYRPMPGTDQPSGPVVIVQFGGIWAWASTEEEAYQRFEKKLLNQDERTKRQARIEALEWARGQCRELRQRDGDYEQVLTADEIDAEIARLRGQGGEGAHE